jgi:hypothetical protein
MNDFYIGYLPNPPNSVADFLKRLVPFLDALFVALALLLLWGQSRFATSTFEYGKVRSFEGVIAVRPYPILQVTRPGQSTKEAEDSQYLLVAPGKHGANDPVTRFDGRHVRLNGELIFRDGSTMLEIVPGSIQTVEALASTGIAISTLGRVTVKGEIVDSKCYMGVMNPGNGKVHRDCAARCISGGIPPIFVSAETRQQYVLVGGDGNALGADSLRDFIAEPIEISGELRQRGDTQILAIDAQSLRHTPDGIGNFMKHAALRN